MRASPGLRRPRRSLRCIAEMPRGCLGQQLESAVKPYSSILGAFRTVLCPPGKDVLTEYGGITSWNGACAARALHFLLRRADASAERAPTGSKTTAGKNCLCKDFRLGPPHRQQAREAKVAGNQPASLLDASHVRKLIYDLDSGGGGNRTRRTEKWHRPPACTSSDCMTRSP